MVKIIIYVDKDIDLFSKFKILCVENKNIENVLHFGYKEKSEFIEFIGIYICGNVVEIDVFKYLNDIEILKEICKKIYEEEGFNEFVVTQDYVDLNRLENLDMYEFEI